MGVDNMTRPIKPTPVLDPKSTKVFLEKIEAKRAKTYPIPTPKLSETLRRFVADALNKVRKAKG
jgi:hypothetical protein